MSNDHEDRYVLRGALVALAPLDKADAPLYTRWINDPAVKAGFLDNGLYTVADEERFIDMLQAQSAQVDPSGSRFAIHELGSGAPIGLTGLFDISWRHRRAELAISMGPAQMRGRGLGTEAVTLTLRWAFEVLSLNSVGLAAIDLGRGTRCWENSGFRHVGRRRQAVLAGGALRDELLMDVLAQDVATPA
ncbi:MAG: GNAT family protein [Solirubrobacteraceae bacterium]